MSWSESDVVRVEGGRFGHKQASPSDIQLDEHRPEPVEVFVYGTLRPGFGNSRNWTGLGQATKATLKGFRMYGRGGGYPYAIPVDAEVEGLADDDMPTMVGDVISFDSEAKRARAMENMDHLEGYPHHYDRVPVEAVDEHGEVRLCWIYTPKDPQWVIDRCGPEGVVESGDWEVADAESRTRRARR